MALCVFVASQCVTNLKKHQWRNDRVWHLGCCHPPPFHQSMWTGKFTSIFLIILLSWRSHCGLLGVVCSVEHHGCVLPWIMQLHGGVSLEHQGGRVGVFLGLCTPMTWQLCRTLWGGGSPGLCTSMTWPTVDGGGGGYHGLYTLVTWQL